MASPAEGYVVLREEWEGEAILSVVWQVFSGSTEWFEDVVGNADLEYPEPGGLAKILILVHLACHMR